MKTTFFEKLPTDLVNYFQNNFKEKTLQKRSPAEPNIEFWEKILEKVSSQSKSDFLLLKSCFPQLNFPIKEGICNETEYRNAVLKGDLRSIDYQQNNLQLQHENQISFMVFNSFAGKVPVLTIPCEHDFQNVIRAFLYKSNPVDLPKSMGASLINGVNNWGRIQGIKSEFLEKNNTENWAKYFQSDVLPFPQLYKDKIIVLSKKTYSNVPAENFEFSEAEWLEISHKIRLFHECTHLYTLKKFGVASNNLHDELIADYIGIVIATGDFKKDWLLNFLGLEDFPKYRAGARLQNYINEIEPASDVFFQLTGIIKKAIDHISVFHQYLQTPISDQEIQMRISALCKTSVHEMASERGAEILFENYSFSDKN